MPERSTTPASRRSPRALPLLLVLVLVACGETGPDQFDLPREHRVATRYAAALGVDLSAMERRPAGLYVQDIEPGEGARADSGDVVTVEYAGFLPQGAAFDRTAEGETFEFALGYGRVIDGWGRGVVGMRVGGERRLVIPPALGYGERGAGPIPGGSTLVFDVRLVDVVNRTPESSR